jgi:phospholipid/cholesterol/gamma-HCH transport system substrate-binding protein
MSATQSPAPKRPRRKRGRRRGLHPLIAAVLVIFAAVFVTFYAFNGGLPFIHNFTVYAISDNSVNVRSGDPVRIAGIDVGTVNGTSQGPGQTTKISFSLQNSGLPIHTDATVTIRDRLFLEGSYYLALDPGSPGAPAVHDGFTIPESNVSSPVQFYKLLSTFNLPTRQSLDNIINNINVGFGPGPGKPESDSGAGALKRAVPSLTPLFKDTSYISQALTGTHANDVERLLSSAANVASTLAGSSTQLANLVSGLDSASTALATDDGDVAQSVSGLDKVLQIAPSSLSAVDHSLPPLAKLGQALDPSLRLAPPIIDGITTAVNELAVVVAPAERRGLLTSLKATFEQFPSLLSLLGQAFPITKQVTDCLNTHVTPILQETVPDGSLSTHEPVWQDFVHFLPGVASATGSFDGNGPYTRTLLGAGTDTVSLGNIPGIGEVVGSEPTGGDSLQGASPQWVGTLQPSDFRPDVPCSKEPVPSLASAGVAADARTVKSTSEPSLTDASLRTLIARADKAVSK